MTDAERQTAFKFFLDLERSNIERHAEQLAEQLAASLIESAKCIRLAGCQPARSATALVVHQGHRPAALSPGRGVARNAPLPGRA